MANLTLAAYQEAERAVALEEGRRGWAVHAAITAAVCVALVIVNVFVADEFPWSIFPVVGMGIGLFAHWYFGVSRSDDMVRHHQLEIEHRAAA
jgi:hypothetical protein